MIEPGQVGAARKRLGLSQAELARRSGVSQSLIAKIERGALDPTYSKLKAIAQALSDGASSTDGPVARDVMEPNVVSMFADETVDVAIAHLSRHGFSQLPVIDQGVLVGTVTEAALLHHVHRHHGQPEALSRPVRDVMTQNLPQVPPETDLDAVEALLDVFPAVLVSANGRVCGIVTGADVLRASAKAERAARPRGESDSTRVVQARPQAPL